MNVGIFVPQEPAMHVDCLTAFAEGLKQVGVRHFVRSLNAGWQSCDVAVTFGVDKQATERGQLVGNIIRKQRRLGRRHLVIERGFVQRDDYFMVGWSGLNGRADFQTHLVAEDRWKKLGVELQPWRMTGEHIVLCGQVPWDASVQHSDHNRWCEFALKQIQKRTERPVVFRPHPCQPDAINLEETKAQRSTASNLATELANAWCVVTYNSNAGVEATIAGIPAFSFDPGSMCYSVSNHQWERINDPQLFPRRQWAASLAYTQWTQAEMAAGLPWLHLAKSDLKTNHTHQTRAA